jgi:hypothetical protein
MMNETGVRSGDGGVSESIGFLLIFTMVIVGIGLVTLYGYPLLLQQQTSADEQIMEKNMIVLQNDMKSLAYKTIPYKETMLNIGGGSLTAYNSSSTPATSTLNIFDTSTGPVVSNFNSGDLRYYSTSAGVDISLQNGAVVMRKLVEPGSVMLAQPRWFYDETTNTMVINLISLNSSERISRSGIGTVQMMMGETTFLPPTHPTSSVCLEFLPDTSPNGQDYSKAWDNYFVNSMKMIPGGGGCNANEYLLPFDYSDPATRPLTLVIKKSDVVIRSL